LLETFRYFALNMTNEEMNKKIEFIVEHQAKFAADLELMRQQHAEDVTLLKAQDRTISNAFMTLMDIVGDLLRAQKRTDESMLQLTEKQARTDERLNALIIMFERFMGGNGGTESPA
jgi:hypothetical protein